MKEIILNQILIPSLQRLYQVDYDNIRFDVSERKPSSQSNRPDCVHDMLLGAFIVFSKEGIEMELYSSSDEDGKLEKANFLGVYMHDKLYVTFVNKTNIQ